MLHPKIGSACNPDLITAPGFFDLFKEVRTVAKVMLTVRSKWFEAFLLLTFDSQFLHKSKCSVPAAVQLFVLEMIMDRSMSVTTTRQLVDLYDPLFEGRLLQTACTRPANLPVVIATTSQAEALVQFVDSEANPLSLH
jgi:hypothetical protein